MASQGDAKVKVPIIEVNSEQNPRIPSMTEHFSSMADSVLSAIRDPSSGVVLAANGMKKSLVGVQQVAGSLPTLGMTEEGRHHAIEGLKNIVNGFSQTFQGISSASMRFNAVRLSLLHGSQAKQIMELQAIREALLRGEHVAPETLEQILKETTTTVQYLQKESIINRETKFTSAGVVIILTALAVIAVVLAILKLPVLLILDSLLTALAVLLGLLAML